MSAFGLTELRRLSETATKGPWAYESSNDCLYAPEDGEDAPPIGDIESVRNATLIAYLGTHRDRIVALLEAADALADAADGPADALADIAYEAHEVYVDNYRNARVAYEKAKGA